MAEVGQLMRSVELVEATGITYRQLDYWTRVGYLLPHTDARGSGTQRAYHESEVGVARLLGLLAPMTHRAHGSLTPDNVAAVCNHVRNGGRGEWQLVPGVTLDLDLLCAPPG